MSIHEAIGWLFFNVVLALLPIGFSYLIAYLLRHRIVWHDGVKEGELFIFATTLSAGTIGECLWGKVADLANKSTFAGALPVHNWAVLPLLLVLVLSACLFAVSVFLKLERRAPPDPALFSTASLIAAFLAILFSFVSR